MLIQVRVVHILKKPPERSEMYYAKILLNNDYVLEIYTKFAETMSDSDSGSSTSSWVFVDENNPSDVNSPNQFYLNCSGEPVQELEENDLGNIGLPRDGAREYNWFLVQVSLSVILILMELV